MYPLKITSVETIWNPRWSNFVWVRVNTDEGLTGLGETFRHPTPVIRYVHDHIAPYLLGADPLPVNLHADNMANSGGMRFLGYPTRSVEIRANSAVDIALWDLKGKAANLPLAELFGGPVRSDIPIYNTCAGPDYNWQAGTARARIAQPGDPSRPADTRVPDDLQAQIDTPGDLACSLLDDGITAMKIWPFDAAAEQSRGTAISSADLRTGLDRIAAIRDAVGDRIDIMLEYHSLWNRAPAERILREVDDFDPFWHEDPIPMADIHALAGLRDRVRGPIAGSESHGSSAWFRDAFRADAVDYAHYDIGWVGGLSEGLKVAHLAAANGRLIAPHDCTGPVVWIANLHLALSQPNALILESVRAFYLGLYRTFVTELPTIRKGRAMAMTAPGLGTELSEELLSNSETQIECTRQSA